MEQIHSKHRFVNYFNPGAVNIDILWVKQQGEPVVGLSRGCSGPPEVHSPESDGRDTDMVDMVTLLRVMDVTQTWSLS